uniref:Uncharacterized protein n=1 Tax=Anguilla anguilla TaxID=7936 RepID=A0A0E9S682_ANGAN
MLSWRSIIHNELLWYQNQQTCTDALWDKEIYFLFLRITGLLYNLHHRDSNFSIYT